MGARAQCRHRDDVIESKGHRWNFVTCGCGAISVDGGDSYSRYVGNPEDFIWDEHTSGLDEEAQTCNTKEGHTTEVRRNGRQ